MKFIISILVDLLPMLCRAWAGHGPVAGVLRHEASGDGPGLRISWRENTDMGTGRARLLTGIGHSLVPAMVLLVTVTAAGEPLLKTGDILFQESRSSQSLAIQKATGSRYSHVGMVVIKDGAPMVLEAVDRTKYTPFTQWIARGDGGHYVVKRYRESGQTLDAAEREKLAAQGEKFLGSAYDPWFQWSDDRQYCSELVHKVYQRALGIELSPLVRLASFDLGDPVVKSRMRERFGETPPLDEPVVAPSALFDSEQLVTVYSQ